MKKSYRIAALVLSLVFAAIGLTSCAQQAKLVEVQMMTPVEKTLYLVGETFDPAGLVLTGVYSDGSRQKVTDYKIDKTAPLTKEDTVVTISANGFDFPIDVKVITKGEQMVLCAVNGVDTLEMYANGTLAAVGGGGGGSLKPEQTKWTWDGKELHIWLTNYDLNTHEPEDHLTEMVLVNNAAGDITFEYELRGRWHMNYTLTAGSIQKVLTPEARFPIAEE
jgi:hypothetical protein